MGFEVLEAGMLTTVQDGGRIGHAREGYPACGACDRHAWRAANLLCGQWEEAALECTLTGPTLRCDTGMIAAACGPCLSLTLNGRPVPAGMPLLLEPGDILRVGPMSAGVRAYLAARGGIRVLPVLGSRSTDLRSGLGGFQGRAMRAGDVLAAGNNEPARFPALRRNANRLYQAGFLPARRTDHVCAHAVKGPQWDALTAPARRQLLTQCWLVSSQSDRMGIRLEGEPLILSDGADILTEGVVEGAVQITGAGRPVVLMADHQTSGGYIKPITVIPTDLPLLAQARPGDSVRFDLIPFEDALNRCRRDAALWEKYRTIMEAE